MSAGRPDRGRHKVFLGMAAGVGKTYAMLEEGHEYLEDGDDVVVGVLETHGREATAARVASGVNRPTCWFGTAATWAPIELTG